MSAPSHIHFQPSVPPVCYKLRNVINLLVLPRPTQRASLTRSNENVDSLPNLTVWIYVYPSKPKLSQFSSLRLSVSLDVGYFTHQVERQRCGKVSVRCNLAVGYNSKTTKRWEREAKLFILTTFPVEESSLQVSPSVSSLINDQKTKTNSSLIAFQISPTVAVNNSG